jgi:hypothetical protein
MAEDFADAFKRYWALILSVAATLVFAGQVYSSLKDDIAEVRSDVRAYIVEREGLLRDINGKFADHDKRITRLESK